MIDLTGNKNRIYLLQISEVIENRPNLDPFSGSLRIEKTKQVRLSDVYIKHHIRRTFPKLIGNPLASFYEKFDKETGKGNTAKGQLDKIRKANGLTKPEKGKKAEKRTTDWADSDAIKYCADTVLFGYVHTQEGENFHRNGAAHPLFWPSTFHECQIRPLNTSNAFFQHKVKDNPESELVPTGGASTDALDYGVFLTLIEVDLPTLEFNSKESQLDGYTVPEEESEAEKAIRLTNWVELLSNGLWEAFDSQRYPSRTQKNHNAKSQIVWQPPQTEVEQVNPLAAIGELKEQKAIQNWPEAEKALKAKVLPWLNKHYQIEGNILWSKGKTLI